jgi:predicted peroxiredoxin
MKKITLFLMVLLCLSLAGCSKDAEINAFITEFDAATKEIVAKIDANPSAAGIDDAQKAFDGKKASLKAKWDGIKGAVGMQVSAETKKKLEESVTNNMKALMDVSIKQGVKMAMDKDASAKFKNLMTDYQATFAVGK